MRRRGAVALIGLSTAVPTRPFMATGTLGLEQLHRLGDVLDELGDGVFRVVMLHHPPVSAPAKKAERLMDAEAFRATLQKHGAELVLHGHDHRRCRLARRKGRPHPGGRRDLGLGDRRACTIPPPTISTGSTASTVHGAAR